jgi:hypothetical protein
VVCDESCSKLKLVSLKIPIFCKNDYVRSVGASMKKIDYYFQDGYQLFFDSVSLFAKQSNA